ncbi:MAG: thiamine ABC transporter substrate-binding protein [Bdellovibrionaceae bacterium]|nr:thiamine ABC transporter substrate-binding protein [Pseudobdellovibrionaceae bacterium]
MQQFIIFISTIFFVLIFSFFKKQSSMEAHKSVVRIFGYSSFISKYGPGEELKKIFEEKCDCQVDFIEASDAGILLQRVKLEGSTLGADLVIGFDQFDLQKALSEIKWRKIDLTQIDINPMIKGSLNNEYFVPYDWGVLSFVTRKEDMAVAPKSLQDLLKPHFKRKLALQDPRTSSPGMQFLYWIKKSFNESDYANFLQQIIEQAHSFSPSWSTAYGLFIKKQAPYVFSYTTSPIYHQIVEKNNQYQALYFTEKHPIQVEFMGIPSDCKECEKAEDFVNLMLTDQGQKIIMNKNFMYPVVKDVVKGTIFESNDDLVQNTFFEIPSVTEVESLLKEWSDARKGKKVAK